MNARQAYVGPLLLGIVCLAVASGCTADRLRYASTRQAGTLGDIYEQQVLNNLAKYVVNPYSTPSFSVATQSTSGASRNDDYGLSDGAFTGRFWSLFHLSGSGHIENNFTFEPVTDPLRIKLMHCAYQKAVGVTPDECDRCCELLAAWTGDPNACNDPCGITCGWVCSSTSWWDVPQCCCAKYANHCGTYVWADPDYQDEFSKLVMAVVDYASGQAAPPASAATEEVTYYFDEFGNPATAITAAKVVHAVVPREANLETAAVKQKLTESIQRKELAIKSLSEANGADEIKRQIRAFSESYPGIKAMASGIDDAEADQVDEIRASMIQDLNSQVTDDKARLKRVESAPKVQQFGSEGAIRSPRMNFGPPTQFNGLYGDGLLKFQQQLNTLPSRRNP
jgi:hypothetical protein